MCHFLAGFRQTNEICTVMPTNNHETHFAGAHEKLLDAVFALAWDTIAHNIISMYFQRTHLHGAAALISRHELVGAQCMNNRQTKCWMMRLDADDNAGITSDGCGIRPNVIVITKRRMRELNAELAVVKTPTQLSSQVHTVWITMHLCRV